VPAYLKERDDALVSVRPVLELAPNFADLLALSLGERQELEGFGSRSANGRPLGDLQFLALVEHKLGRTVRRAKPGPKPKHPQR
jgi:putative transposase